MPTPPRSSRRRFADYRRLIRTDPDRARADLGRHDDPRTRRKRSRAFFPLFKAFWGQLEGHRRLLTGSLILLGISTLLGLVPFYGTKLVFDNVLGDQPLPHWLAPYSDMFSDKKILLLAVATAMVSISSIAAITNLWSRWQATRMTKRVQVSVRRRLFEHTVRLPLHRVYELKSGGVTSMLREDAGGVGDLIFSMLYNPWRALVQLCGVLAVLTMISWKLLAGAILLLPAVWITHRTWISKIRPIHRDIRRTRQTIDSHTVEAFGGMRVVRSFSRQKAEARSYSTGIHMMSRQEVLSWWWSRGVDLAWELIIPLASALLLFFGGGKVLTDMQKVQSGLLSATEALTVGDLVMFLSYLVALLGPIAVLANSATGLQSNLAGLDRVMDLLEEPVEMPDKPGAREVSAETVQGAIRFRDVTFKYANSATPVLHHINAEIRAGEMIALVGPSGAGKTTLCNLVARFYDPTEGGILLDGTDLRDIKLDSYRRLLGIVEQDTFLFDGTIAENIAYSSRGATMTEIRHIAQLANAHEFIEKLPEQYEAIIGERGVKLSGGQRQRITIARALLADPKILILDEATSNLDSESERMIQTSLQTLMQGRTTFVIAHRLSTIAHADRIFVMEQGRIIEQGRHEELMQSDTRYRDMVLLQTSPPVTRRIGPIEDPQPI